MIFSLSDCYLKKLMREHVQSYTVAERVFIYKGLKFKVVKMATGYYAVAVRITDDLPFTPFFVKNNFRDVKDYINVTIQLRGNI